MKGDKGLRGNERNKDEMKRETVSSTVGRCIYGDFGLFLSVHYSTNHDGHYMNHVAWKQAMVYIGSEHNRGM